MKDNGCYGNMVPDLLRLEYNKPNEGKAFTVFVEQRGIGVQSRAVNVKPDEWRGCVACESYHDCYDLSMAKLLLQHAI
jgi:hypothetical protein